MPDYSAEHPPAEDKPISTDSSWEKMEAQIKELKEEVDKIRGFTLRDAFDIAELQIKLKETIRAVERLAKGKSLGTLGLPTEESWQQSAS